RVEGPVDREKTLVPHGPQYAAVTGAERRPEVGARGPSSSLLDQRLSAAELVADRLIGKTRERRVVPGVIAQFVPFCDDPPGHLRVAPPPLSREKEGGMHRFAGQRVEDLRGRARVSSRVEREGNFGPM